MLLLIRHEKGKYLPRRIGKERKGNEMKYWTNLIALFFGVAGISSGALLGSKFEIAVGVALLVLAVVCPADERFEEGEEK